MGASSSHRRMDPSMMRLPWDKRLCNRLVDIFMRRIVRTPSVLNRIVQSFTCHGLHVCLKGGAAYAAHVWQHQSYARVISPPMVRDVDLQILRDGDETSLLVPLCSAANTLDSYLTPLLSKDLMLPAGIILGKSPPVTTVTWGGCGEDTLQHHLGTSRTLTLIRRGYFHGNSGNFHLWRIAVSLLDGRYRLRYVPIIDLACGIDVHNLYSETCSTHCGKALKISKLQCDHYRMLTHEARLRPWICFSVKEQRRFERLVALSLMRDQRRARTAIALFEASELEEWLIFSLKGDRGRWALRDPPRALRSSLARTVSKFIRLVQDIPVPNEWSDDDLERERFLRLMCHYVAKVVRELQRMLLPVRQ